jgi:hypothetical protein
VVVAIGAVSACKALGRKVLEARMAEFLRSWRRDISNWFSCLPGFTTASGFSPSEHSAVSMPVLQARGVGMGELILRQAAIRNSVTSLLTNHNRLVMVCL